MNRNDFSIYKDVLMAKYVFFFILNFIQIPNLYLIRDEAEERKAVHYQNK